MKIIIEVLLNYKIWIAFKSSKYSIYHINKELFKEEEGEGENRRTRRRKVKYQSRGRKSKSKQNT
jgi:hypothetical protein